MRTPKHLVQLVRNLYQKNSANVRIDVNYLGSFRAIAGAKKGCIISPTLFNAYREYVMREVLDEWQSGLSIGGKRINDLRYADDTLIRVNNFDYLGSLITTNGKCEREIYHRLTIARSATTKVNKIRKNKSITKTT